MRPFAEQSPCPARPQPSQAGPSGSAHDETWHLPSALPDERWVQAAWSPGRAEGSRTGSTRDGLPAPQARREPSLRTETLSLGDKCPGTGHCSGPVLNTHRLTLSCQGHSVLFPKGQQITVKC